jgi:hypothetical protein
MFQDGVLKKDMNIVRLPEQIDRIEPKGSFLSETDFHPYFIGIKYYLAYYIIFQ